MSGLTSRQQWIHDHITRCTCGAWTVLTDKQLRDGHVAPCTHVTAAAMETAA